MNQTETAADETPVDVSSMSGLEQLRAMGEGRLPKPPIGELIGMEDFVGEEGTFSVELTPEPRHYNPLGSVHGGIFATMLDTVAACAVHTTLAPGEAYTSLDLTVKFLRPVTTASGRLRATGTVVQRGRRTALAEARLQDAEGRLVAHATSTCMIFA